MRLFLSSFLCVIFTCASFAAEQTVPSHVGSELRALTRPQACETRRESSSDNDLNKNGDARSIEPGGTLVLGDLEGPGAITHMWCTVGAYDPFYPRSLVLRITYDGLDHPSVEVPLGDFFGVGHGAQVDFTSAVVATSSYGRARTCYWRIPFQKRALVTVTNESEEYEVDSFYYYLDWEKHEALPEDTLYFHARYNQAAPAEPGNYVILDTKGRGHYVGTVYSVHQMELGWFGEGDDFFHIDGEEMPSLRGTGTEDYFSDAWGFRQFSKPYYGVSLWEGYFPGDRVTAYRWHLPDPISFKESLHFEIEHKGSVFTDSAEHLGQFIERSDWISSVAYWYQTPPAVFSERIAPVEKRVAPYRVFNAADLVLRATPESAVEKDGPTVYFRPGKQDGSIEFDFEVPEDGRYQVNALVWYSLFGGVYQPYLDDEPLGAPRDFCVSGQDPVWLRLDLHSLFKGTHTLRFEKTGPSPNRRTMVPPANAFGMTYLILLRLEDMAGYHEALKGVQKEN
ncbi:MAG: glycoside hydrolase family 172 protein [Candidatus Hydrogenedentota bacterium]